MSNDFLGPPRKLAKEYAQHLLLVGLDVLFMLGWVSLQAAYHFASDWIVEHVGLGAVDKTVKVGFDIVFASITFFWVVSTVWKVHRDAHKRIRTRQPLTREAGGAHEHDHP
jgi:hypothetical protein